MEVPSGPPGTIYINRDRDFITNEWGNYVKIGLVKDEREAETRRKEHQTGNPREVLIVREFESPLVTHLETRLHNRYAERRVSGEWFLMDDDFVKNELYPTIESMISKIENDNPYYLRSLELINIESNGVIRDPTQDEIDLHQQYKDAKERNERVTASIAILKRQLVELAGNAGGINRIIDFSVSINKESIKVDWNKLKDENPAKIAPFLIFEEAKLGPVSGALRIKKTQPLSQIDENLANLEAEANSILKSITVSQAENAMLDYTDEAKSIHGEYLSLLGEEFDTRIEMELIKSKLVDLLGEDEGIKDIVAWSRTREEIPEKIKFNKKEFQKRHQQIVDAYSSINPESKKVSIKVTRKQGRRYPF
jgi:hypothetical protein